MSNIVIITGGGTGGHLSVAKSFIEEYYKLGFKVIFIGSSNGQDKQWFGTETKLYKSYFFDTRGVVNQNLLGKLKSLFLIFRAVLKSALIIKTNGVKKVISVGGFSAASTSIAAGITRTDFYIHEQNSVMGKLNKLSSKWAKEIFSSYLQSSKVKDYPINKKYFEHSRIRKSTNCIIFLGGSQGATAINNFAIKVAPTLNKLNIKIIHQTGKNDFINIKKQYKELNIDADVFDFSKNLLEKMEEADFAVSRAGASTLWELVALGIPTLFIPYPYAAANHQYHNAKYLSESELCYLKYEDELTSEYLIDTIKKDTSKISKNLIDSIKKDSIKNIIHIINTN